MKTLIIGGTGFAGGYLAEYLKQAGCQTAVTRLPSIKTQPSETQPSIKTQRQEGVYELDILDPDAVFSLFQKLRPDVVFHLAAQSSVADSWKHPQATIDVNIRGSMNVLEAARRQEKKIRILLAGSSEEYGNVRPHEIPVRERQRVRPVNIYAATKACQNMIGSIYAQAYGMDVVMVRAFNHIGPGQAPAFAVADFCRQTAQIEAGCRQAVIKTGNLAVKRDFTDVRDVVRAYALLAEKGKAGETYNVGSGHAVSLGEVLEVILAQSSAGIRVETAAEKFRPADVPVMEADIRKIRRTAGWEPQIRLEQTVREMLDEWRGVMDGAVQKEKLIEKKRVKEKRIKEKSV